MRALTLDSKQQAVVDDILAGHHEGGAIFAAPMGEGKTAPAAKVALLLGAKVILLAVPLGTRVGWERTFRALGYTGEFYRLTSAAKHKGNFDLLKAGSPGVYLIGWEYMVRQKSVNWSSIKPDVVIGDEIHRAQNRRAETSKCWKRIQPRIIRIGASGTWFGNSFEGAWAVARASWPHLIDNSFWRWVSTWARMQMSCPDCHEEFFAGEEECSRCGRVITERNVIRKVVGEKEPGAFAASLPGYYYWESDENKDELWKLPPLEHKLYVELSPKHRKMYSGMEDNLVSWVEHNNPLVAEMPVSRFMRLRQMALGIPMVETTGKVKEDGTPETRVWFEDDAESPKIDTLNEFLKDHPNENVLVLTDSKVFASILPGRLNANVRLWTGDTPHAEREDILRDWGTDPDNREVLVATIAAIGEGVDGLQHVCNTVVWLNKSTNGILNEQAAARVARRGQLKRVVSVEIIAVETEDEPDNSRLGKALIERRASIQTPDKEES